MKVLLIGGPRFLGYALTKSLLARRHRVTFFNRGKTNAELFPEIKKIRGERDGEISNIGDARFDAVIDTCGYLPRVVKQSVDYLKDKATYYIFISSISVYTGTESIDYRDENSPVYELPDPTTEKILDPPSNYGGLKALCERTVQEGFGEKAIVLRPGYIVGPRDPSHRFTYWPTRIRKGGNVLAPGDKPSKVQLVDVRDIADFVVTLLEQKKGGVYNVTGPATEPYEFKELLEQIKEIIDPKVEFSWVTDEWLNENEVRPGKDFPIWDPSEEDQSLMNVNIDRALRDGLKFRPLKETVKALLEWYDSIEGDTKEWPVGLSLEREKELFKMIEGKN